MEKLRIVIGGFIGLYPSGGVTWDYIQYMIGLADLGHDVYYIEDTGQYSNYRITERAWDDPHDTVQYLKHTMEHFGFEGKWAYRDLFSRQCYGMNLRQLMKVCTSADVFINISDSSIYRDEYMQIPHRVLIDSDPMFTQLQTNEILKEDPRYPARKFRFQDYNHFFSFGENIGKENCKIPTGGIDWLPTRQPICLEHWKKNGTDYNRSYTTVMNWSTRTSLVFDDQEWGQKDIEFRKFMGIPKLMPSLDFKVVMAVSAAFRENVRHDLIENFGWHVIDPGQTVRTTKDYRRFIADSAAEFSVAKETYVKSNSGWFSCRSACYLAMGKPVVVQETQWSSFIQSGKGALAFHDIDSAKTALREVDEHYEVHSKAAVELANEYFDSGKVLTDLINRI